MSTKTKPAPRKPQLPAKVEPVKVAAVPAGRQLQPRVARPASTTKRETALRAAIEEIDPELWVAVVSCRNLENTSRADEIAARRAQGRLLSEVYVRHEKNNKVTSLMGEALQTNAEYLRAAIQLFRMFPNDGEFGTLLSQCQTIGVVPSWSVVRRFIALARPGQWKTAFERAAQGLITSDNYSNEMKKLNGLNPDAEPTRALAGGAQRTLPLQVGKLSDAIRERVSLFQSWCSVDGGLGGHAKKLIEAKPVEEWDSAMLVSVRTMRESIQEAAAVAAKEVDSLAAIESRIQQQLEASHKVPSAARPKVSAVATPVPAAAAPPKAPVMTRKAAPPAGGRAPLKGLRK